MNNQDFIKLREERILAYYNNVHEFIREDIIEAAKWAKQTLCIHEGSGHIFQIYGTMTGGELMVACSFSKPEWPGEHSSRSMETGSEAIVMAISEYINGA